jgi:hypothetical protein
LFKAQPDRIERLQHRIVQFPSDAAAIVKQGAQSSFGCREGRGEAASDLFTQQAGQKPSCIVGNPLYERPSLLRQLARTLPKPVENLEPLPIFHQSELPF